MRLRARSDELVGLQHEHVVVRVQAPPVDGRANESVRRVIARAFDVSIGRVAVTRGARGRTKRIAIELPARWPPVLAATGVPPLPE